VCLLLSWLETIPDEETALQLAAPAVAVAANQSKLVGHTAPLLPTPPSMTTIAAAAAAAGMGSAGLAGAVPAMAAALAGGGVTVIGTVGVVNITAGVNVIVRLLSLIY